jgi:hypothetical protein
VGHRQRHKSTPHTPTKHTKQSHLNTNNSKENKTSSSHNNSSSSDEGWSAAHVQFYQAKEMKKWILLDNGSTVDLFCNPNLATNIHTTTEMLDVSTNSVNFLPTKKQQFQITVKYGIIPTQSPISFMYPKWKKNIVSPTIQPKTKHSQCIY